MPRPAFFALLVGAPPASRSSARRPRPGPHLGGSPRASCSEQSRCGDPPCWRPQAARTRHRPAYAPRARPWASLATARRASTRSCPNRPQTGGASAPATLRNGGPRRAGCGPGQATHGPRGRVRGKPGGRAAHPGRRGAVRQGRSAIAGWRSPCPTAGMAPYSCMCLARKPAAVRVSFSSSSPKTAVSLADARMTAPTGSPPTTTGATTSAWNGQASPPVSTV